MSPLHLPTHIPHIRHWMAVRANLGDVAPRNANIVEVHLEVMMSVVVVVVADDRAYLDVAGVGVGDDYDYDGDGRACDGDQMWNAPEQETREVQLPENAP